MTLDAFTSAGALWLIGALAMGIGELVVPGVFLVFLAVAAAITGVATLVLADLPVAAQLGSFAAWSVVCVLAGRRWYADYPVETTDPLLNDRAARMIGQSVVVTQAIVGGAGRVRVGDGEWPATGADAAVGAVLRVRGVRDGIVEVVAIRDGVVEVDPTAG